MFNFRLKVISDGLLSRGRQTRVQIETAPYSVDVCTLDSQTHSADADLELELELENVKFKKIGDTGKKLDGAFIYIIPYYNTAGYPVSF